MRKLCLAALALLVVAPAAGAETNLGFMGGGVRAGFRFSPDQIILGGQLDLGEFATNLRFMPNASIGFGDHETVLSINPEAHYMFRDDPINSRTWFYAGGGLDFVHASVDLPGPNVSDTSLGLSLTGGLEHQLNSSQSLAGEVRMVFDDDSFFELVGVWNFAR